MQIITITGEAGTGKDTIARYLEEREDYNFVVSHTTRPRRPDDLIDAHIWETEFPVDTKCFAYTMYGGHHYWTTWDQFVSDRPNVYVVDEQGLADVLTLKKSNEMLLETAKFQAAIPDTPENYEAHLKAIQFSVFSIKVVTNDEVKKERGVTQERIDRDKTRNNPIPNHKYDAVIKNNKSMVALKHQIGEVVEMINKR